MKINNNNGSHLLNLDTFIKRRKFFRFLRRWTSVLFITLILLVMLNIHLIWRNYNVGINRKQYTLALMKSTIQELQNTNEKAVKVMLEVNSLLKITQDEMFRDQLAGLLVDALTEENAKVNFFDMVKVVESAQKYAVELSSYPFTYKDLIAIGWLESDFKINCNGTHGERGIWQILYWKKYLQDLRKWDAYDIDNNCHMAVLELKDKYGEKGNYRDAIIAYNGWVIKEGEVKTTYYNAFMMRKHRVDALCNKAEGKVNAIWR